ncbi:MAG: hypothetical protein AAGA90_14295 [Actinomycetota bacterium]
MKRIALAALIGIGAAACGTASTDVDFDEPVPTLFADDDPSDTQQATTTTAPPIGVDDVDPEALPGPVAEAAGVVVFDSVAAAVVDDDGTTWTVETPCGALRSGDTPRPTTAVVVLDPSGDAGSASGADALARNATLAALIRDRLAVAEITAITTRAAPADVAAAYRSRVADAAGARVVVSIALVDGAGEPGPEPALEVVHPAADAESRRLAGLVHEAVAPVIERFSVGWPDDVEPGVRAVLNQRGGDYFTVLQAPSAADRAVVHLPVDPAVADTVWSSEANLAPIGDAIADAIVRHLVTEDEGSGFVAPPEVVRDAAAVDPAATCVDPPALSEAP